MTAGDETAIVSTSPETKNKEKGIFSKLTGKFKTKKQQAKMDDGVKEGPDAISPRDAGSISSDKGEFARAEAWSPPVTPREGTILSPNRPKRRDLHVGLSESSDSESDTSHKHNTGEIPTLPVINETIQELHDSTEHSEFVPMLVAEYPSTQDTGSKRPSRPASGSFNSPEMSLKKYDLTHDVQQLQKEKESLHADVLALENQHRHILETIEIEKRKLAHKSDKKESSKKSRSSSELSSVALKNAGIIGKTSPSTSPASTSPIPTLPVKTTTTPLVSGKNNKKEEKRKSGPKAPVSPPFNVVHSFHTSGGFNWITTENPHQSFSFVSKLGDGTLGSSYLCRHLETGFEVVVKVIPNSNAQIAAEIQRQVEKLKSLDSNRVVTYYGTCITPTEVWVLSEYCSIKSVQDLMDSKLKTLSEEQIGAVIKYSLAGLHYLHERSLSHGALKPSNILLNGLGEGKLTDFGLYSCFPNQNEPVKLLSRWSPPELTSETGYTPKSDIWSLGISIIEMGEGLPTGDEVPENNTSVKKEENTAVKKEEISDESESEEVPIINQDGPHLAHPSKWSTELVDFVRRCLHKDPQLRPSASNLMTHPFLAKSASIQPLLDGIAETLAFLRSRKDSTAELTRLNESKLTVQTREEADSQFADVLKERKRHQSGNNQQQSDQLPTIPELSSPYIPTIKTKLESRNTQLLQSIKELQTRLSKQHEDDPNAVEILSKFVSELFPLSQTADAHFLASLGQSD